MIELALIKGFCVGITYDDEPTEKCWECRLFLGLLYVGIFGEYE